MAVVDYEQAWVRLGELIASKPHHGSKDLALDMQRIAAECRAPEGSIPMLLRLYGVEVQMGLRAEPDEEPDGVDRSPVDVMASRQDHRHTTTDGGHDGSIHAGAAAAAH